MLHGLHDAWPRYLDTSIAITVPRGGNTALTCDVPPALSTARVTDRAQQITWILKKDPRKLLQPRANISCTRTWSIYKMERDKGFKVGGGGGKCSSSTWLGSTSYPCLAASVLPIAKLMTYPTIAREKAVLNMSSHWLTVGRIGAGNLENKDKT